MQYFCILFKAALEDAAAANGLPLEEKSLSEILGTDEDGSRKRAASVQRCPDGSGSTEEKVEQISDHSPTF